MNLVGKIFTVFIFLMSVMFATLATMVYSTHINWRKVSTECVQKLDQEKEKTKQLQAQQEDYQKQVETERIRQQRVTGQLESELGRLRDDKKKDTEDIAALRGQIDSATMAVKAAHATLATLRDEADKLRVQIKEANDHRDKKVAELVKATDDLHNAALEKARLEKITRQLQDQIAILTSQIGKLGEDPGRPKLGAPPKDIVAQVTAAPRPDVVEISIGSDDGVAKGHRFEVVRTGMGQAVYVGRVEVVETYPERAVCRPDPAVKLKSPIQKGDRVYASLSGTK